MKTITQNYIINASPEEVYAAITNPFSIELWSGMETNFRAEENFEFSIFDGDINGKNVKLIQNELIKQELYMGEGIENSYVTISLKKNKEKTDISLSHENIPDELFNEIKEWWKYSYWAAVKDFFWK